jgi:hypothetical protein
MEQQISGKIEEFIARLSIDTTFGGRRFITEDGELPSPAADDKPKAPITIDMSVKATGTAETGDIADLVKSKSMYILNTWL